MHCKKLTEEYGTPKSWWYDGSTDYHKRKIKAGIDDWYLPVGVKIYNHHHFVIVMIVITTTVMMRNLKSLNMVVYDITVVMTVILLKSRC